MHSNVHICTPSMSVEKKGIWDIKRMFLSRYFYNEDISFDRLVHHIVCVPKYKYEHTIYYAVHRPVPSQNYPVRCKTNALIKVHRRKQKTSGTSSVERKNPSASLVLAWILKWNPQDRLIFKQTEPRFGTIYSMLNTVHTYGLHRPPGLVKLATRCTQCI